MQDPTQAFKLIKVGRLIDGMGGPPIQDGAVLVQGNRIIAAGPVGEVVAPEGATVETYDYPGKTVMPGMIDCHTHHNGFGDGRPGENVAALPDEVIMFRLREAVNLGIVQAPRMVLCGRPIAIVGGHMGYFGSEVTGPVEATAAVRQLIKEGADYIKISATGGSTRTSFPLLPAFTLDELKAMTGEAHKFGKLTATHCASTQGTIDSLDAGVDMIIHCVFKDADGKANFREDVAERIGAQGAYVNPTVHTARATLWSLQRRKEAEGLTVQEQARLDESLWELEVRWTHLARLIEMGLKIITGSDSSWSSYKLGNTVYETECLVQAGMSPMKGIVSVTSDAAKSLGIDSVTGSLEPGKEADVIIVDGNPAEDINALWNIAEVFLGGQKVDRGPESVLAGVRQHPPVSRPESSIESALEASH